MNPIMTAHSLVHEGIQSFQNNDLDHALECGRKAIELAPTESKAYHLMAAVFLNGNEPKTAERCVRMAISLSPNTTEYHDLLGTILRNQNRHEEAIQEHQEAITHTLKPSAQLYRNLCQAYFDNHQFEKALTAIEQAIAIDPSHISDWMMKGSLHTVWQRYEEAEEIYVTITTRDPNHAKGWNNLGNSYVRQAKFKPAIDAYHKALEINPSDPGIWINLCSAVETYGDEGLSRETLNRCIEQTQSDGIKLRLALLTPHIFSSSDELEIARAQLENALLNLEQKSLYIPFPEDEFSGLPFYHAYHGKNDRPLLESFAKAMRKFCPTLNYVSPSLTNHAHRPHIKRRVGIISSCFSGGIVNSCFYEPFKTLATQDPDLEIIIFTPTKLPPNEHESLLIHFSKLIHLSGRLSQAQNQIENEQCDILLYTDLGMNAFMTFLAFARLAPIQCTTTGHPITSGLSTIDYYLSSSLIEPENAQEHYTEKLILLDHIPGRGPAPFLPDNIKSKQELGLPEQGNLYICPVSPHKIHPDLYPIFKAILERDSTAHLILFEYLEPNAWTPQLQSALQKNLGESLYKRVCFLPWARHEQFSHILLNCEVILDPFHFSMGSTAYIVLGLGLPLIAWPGEFMRGRGGYALYNRMKIFDLVAHSHDEYLELAIQVANNTTFRTTIIQKIQEKNHILQDFLPAVHDLSRALHELKPIQRNL